MRKILSAILALAAAAACAAPANGVVELDRAAIFDKIKGGWIGKFIGCTYGGPTEFKYNNKLIPDSVKLEFDARAIRRGIANGFFHGLYDDIYLDITFMDVFERLGFEAPRREFIMSLAESDYKLWCANLRARMKFYDGADADEPVSWRTNQNSDDLDFQIEADYAGLMSPAMPSEALKRAETVGRGLNSSDGFYCGALVAAMYSFAFVYDTPREVVENSALILPKESITFAMVSDILDYHKKNPGDWKAAWSHMHSKYKPSSKGNIFAPSNMVYVIIGLLYGGGDFEKTADIATRCGLDSDCNPSTACGILGTIQGYSKIPKKWAEPLAPYEDTVPFQGTSYTLAKTCAVGYSHALRTLEKCGAKFDGKKYSVELKAPERLKYETNAMWVGDAKNPKIPEGYENFIASGAVAAYATLDKFDLPALTPENPAVEKEFFGTGARCEFADLKKHEKSMQPLKSEKGGECARIDVYLDGKKVHTAVFRREPRFRRYNIYENYDLPARKLEIPAGKKIRPAAFKYEMQFNRGARGNCALSTDKHKIRLELKNAADGFPPIELRLLAFEWLKK